MAHLVLDEVSGSASVQVAFTAKESVDRTALHSTYGETTFVVILDQAGVPGHSHGSVVRNSARSPRGNSVHGS